MKLDEKKLAKLKTTNQLLDEKYGEHGTATREKFNENAMAWYYGTYKEPIMSVGESGEKL